MSYLQEVALQVRVPFGRRAEHAVQENRQGQDQGRRSGQRVVLPLQLPRPRRQVLQHHLLDEQVTS